MGDVAQVSRPVKRRRRVMRAVGSVVCGVCGVGFRVGDAVTVRGGMRHRECGVHRPK